MIIKIRSRIKPLVPKSFLSVFRLIRGNIVYRGNSVECSVCGGQFSKMRDYQMENRSSKGEICPRCGAKSRHRLYVLYFKNQGILNSNLRILHIAPDPGLRRILEPGNRYLCADLLEQNVDLNVNIQTTPFADNIFDVIICSHVLEHVDDDRQAMRDMFRILKPGGWALLQTPLPNPDPDKTYEDKSITNQQDRLKHFGQEDHVRLYGKNDFYHRLQDAGYTLDLSFVEHLSDSDKERFVIRDPELVIAVK